LSRTNKSARNAGSSFERSIADYLATALNDDRIDRRVKYGKADRGDIAGLRTRDGRRITVECKNVIRPALAQWAAEAENERMNDNAIAGIIVHKRHGRGKPEDQWVTMTTKNLVALLTGERPENV
jgi:hypothetical protein